MRARGQQADLLPPRWQTELDYALLSNCESPPPDRPSEVALTTRTRRRHVLAVFDLRLPSGPACDA